MYLVMFIRRLSYRYHNRWLSDRLFGRAKNKLKTHIRKVCLLPPGARCGPDAVKRLSLDNRGYNKLKKNLDGRGNILEGPRCVGNLGLVEKSLMH